MLLVVLEFHGSRLSSDGGSLAYRKLDERLGLAAIAKDWLTDTRLGLNKRHARNVVRFYNGRGTAEQWIKEGEYALKWTRLSCRRFVDNAVRLQLFSLAYNLANFMRRLVLPRPVKHWSLTTLREKLIKTGARIVRHARYVTFQMAEVAVPRALFEQILRRILGLVPLWDTE